MGLGKIINGRHQAITPWMGSWAQQEEARRAGHPAVPPRPPYTPPDNQWPLGYSPHALRLPGRYDQHGNPI
jgi:hypothetical protein